jgi:Asp-tRNA(Asn)/Glu-tRNA(Gln) amidotransferase A subunit family amidase
MAERSIGECEFLIEDALAQIEMLDAQIGAWEFVDRAAAIAQARQLDQSAKRGLLYGMSVGVKDIIDVAGMPTSCGTPIYAGNIAKRDAGCVAFAKAAGAIVIGKTVTTELAGTFPAKTRNPQNLEHTPGGSSSGSAAAVAAGMVRIAFGTQTAGSVIRPAAYCGVVGYKPTFGLVSRVGMKVQSESLDTVGVFARTIDDAALWFAAMIGSAAPPLQNFGKGALRILIVSNLMDHAEVDMSVAVAEAAEALASAGLSVRETRLPIAFDAAQTDQRIIQLAEMAGMYATEHEQHRHQLSNELVALLDEGAAISANAYQTALLRTESARKQAAQLFIDADVLLMPSATGAAPRGFATTGDPVFNRLASTLHLPAINLPVYRSKKRLPLGLQLIGAQLQDEKLLSVAKRVIDILRSNTHD